MATKAEKPKTDKPKAEDPAAAADGPPKKKSKKKLVFFLLALFLVAGGAGAAWHFMQPPAEGDEVAEEEEVEETKKAPPVYVTLENFVVNLRDDDGDHYLQLGIVLEVSDQATVDEVKLQMPRIRNAILLLLSSKNSEEISTLEGKKQLTEQILAETRAPMDSGDPSKGIESVYFSAFVIQ
jgi:flagellar protein FliL